MAEITQKREFELLATPSNGIPRQNNIYELYIGNPPISSYWTDWGGYYDEYRGRTIELYFGQYLVHVNSLSELFQTEFSVFIQNKKAYFNIPKQPWLYSGHKRELNFVLSYLASAHYRKNPSMNILDVELLAVKLETPSITIKLADNISGITQNKTFSASFINNDGYFDNDALFFPFNTPVHIKKTTKDNPSFADFKEIRGGLIEDVEVSMDSVKIEVADKYRTLEEMVTDVIKQENFAFPLKPEAVDKEIPVVYGAVKANVIELAENKYLLAEYVAAVSAVYDKDGVVIPPANWSFAGGVLTATDAKSAAFTGYAENRIGYIVKDLLIRKSHLLWNDTNYDTQEFTAYAETSPRVNIMFDKGETKKAVDELLKSDMAYLIQKTSGQFTMRKYGAVYNARAIPSWVMTQKPKRNKSFAQTMFFSSCLIKFNYNYDTKEYDGNYLIDENEAAVEDIYNKTYRMEFETRLATKASAESLARLLSIRFSTMRETIQLGIGQDTSDMSLLDSIEMDIHVNGREFSQKRNWMIKEINPAQDILTLEEV
jgi:hypothetical protein